MEKRIISLLILSSVLFFCVGMLLGHFLTVDDTECFINPPAACEPRVCKCMCEEIFCPTGQNLEGDLLTRIRDLDKELTESEEDNKEARDFMRKVARELLK